MAVNRQRLEDAAREYRSWPRENPKWLDDATVDEVINRATTAIWPCKRKHPHQWRLKIVDLEAAEKVVSERKREVEGARDFEVLLNILNDVARQVKGFGPVAAYDTAQRIGMWLNLEPKRVYLHAGTTQGAAKLGIDVQGVESLSVSQIKQDYPELKPLNAVELEDFLCIYKDNFAPHGTGGCAKRGCRCHRTHKDC